MAEVLIYIAMGGKYVVFATTNRLQAIAFWAKYRGRDYEFVVHADGGGFVNSMSFSEMTCFTDLDGEQLGLISECTHG